MILGVDVGSTHTDGVLMEGREVIAKIKTATRKENLLASFEDVADSLKADVKDGLKRIVLSTTLTTNAVVENRLARTALILIPGPGLAPSHLNLTPDTYYLDGYINHRGVEVDSLDERQIGQIARTIEKEGICFGACAGKFSTRNPAQELRVKAKLKGLEHVSLGHQLSGRLNFPRRAATALLNASVWGINQAFIHQVLDFINKWQVHVPVYILKADGGTFSLASSLDMPVQAIHSGPAASIMGILAAFPERKDAVAVDIGGTTTDVAIFAQGVPLLMPRGVTIGRYKTNIRGLRTKSIGIGGDSRIVYEEGDLKIGPQREGPAAACGGPCPTPTDAMIILGLTNIGRRDLAEKALVPLSSALQLPLEKTAEAILSKATSIIAGEIAKEIADINNQPVYTIHEYLEGRRLAPEVLYVVGGAARVFASPLGSMLKLPFLVPPHAEVANAIGAALAQTTAELTLLADTEQGRITIAEEGWNSTIPAGFRLSEARNLIMTRLKERALNLGAKSEDIEVEITEEQVYPVVRSFYRTGENIRLRAQIKPGLIVMDKE